MDNGRVTESGIKSEREVARATEASLTYPEKSNG
jgi:hypothetical protein